VASDRSISSWSLAGHFPEENEIVTKLTLTDRQREKWRLDRARLRAMAKLFPAPPKIQLTPDEKRELRNAKAREARATKALGTVDLTCPLFDAKGRLMGKKAAPKPAKRPQNRAEGPWDLQNRSTT
jgi:hypothetical protein